jgi:hypothetical protein
MRVASTLGVPAQPVTQMALIQGPGLAAIPMVANEIGRGRGAAGPSGATANQPVSVT